MADLAGYGCIRVTGEDAAGFLQGQLSNDVTAVPVGEGQLSSFNDPKGRVLALPRLIRTPDGFDALLPRALCDATARRLAMFVLRSRVSVRPLADARVLAASGETAADRLAAAGVPAIRLPGDSGLCMWAETGDAQVAPQEVEPLGADQLALAEIMAGIPEIYPETAGLFVAQMLDLDRLGAVSYEKGCYVGQEVIARAHHLGRVKRHMARFESTGGCGPGDPVLLDGRKVGVVVRRAPGAGTRPALAVMKDGVSGEMSAGAGRLLPAE
jgi:folate-binding protein YgfZ